MLISPRPLSPPSCLPEIPWRLRRALGRLRCYAASRPSAHLSSLTGPSLTGGAAIQSGKFLSFFLEHLGDGGEDGGEGGGGGGEGGGGGGEGGGGEGDADGGGRNCTTKELVPW